MGRNPREAGRGGGGKGRWRNTAAERLGWASPRACSQSQKRVRPGICHLSCLVEPLPGEQGGGDLRLLPMTLEPSSLPGEFSKPSLQAHQRGVVTARENVTLQCQRPNNSFESVKFALLKAGAAEPIRVQGPAKKKMNFSLRSVTVSDAGNYSCVYFLMRAPFWASEPSNHLEITVKGEAFTVRRTADGLPAC